VNKIDPLNQILFYVWMLVLPTIAVVLMVLIPIWWWIIVPRISRRLTWARFGNKTLVVFGDDHGYADIQVSKSSMPEGVVEFKNGYHFLPRRTSEDEKVGSKGEKAKRFNTDFMYRRFTLKDHGKPLWFGYVGKVGLVNPETLSAIAGKKLQTNPHNPASNIAELTPLIAGLPSNVSKDTKKRMKEIVKSALEKPEGTPKDLTLADPTKIKQVIAKNYTPSQLEAYGKKRELIGMKKAGSQVGKYVMGIGVLIILLVIAVIVVMVMTQSGIFSPQPTKKNIASAVALLQSILSPHLFDFQYL